MSVERTFYCDAQDCDRHISTLAINAPGFVTTIERDPIATTELHFCSWDCVLKYAASREPVEII